VVTCGGAAEQPRAADCETEADQLIASEMLPNQNHPLTRAYMLGARATSPQAMTEAMRLIRACEGAADQLTIDQCKLAADVLLERKAP
jgi:hypothetical protein